MGQSHLAFLVLFHACSSTQDQRLMSELISLISPQVDHTENQGNAYSKLGFQEKGGRGSTLICGKSLLTLRGTLQMSIWRKEKMQPGDPRHPFLSLSVRLQRTRKRPCRSKEDMPHEVMQQSLNENQKVAGE
ncbi:unnamed protein product [Lepidochelys kempii]